MLSAFVIINMAKTLGSVAELVDAPDLKSNQNINTLAYSTL